MQALEALALCFVISWIGGAVFLIVKQTTVTAIRKAFHFVKHSR